MTAPDNEAVERVAHTALPWAVAEGPIMPEIRSGYTNIADIRWSGHNEGHGKANAAFIVEAANNYYPMKARIAELEAALREVLDGHGCQPGYLSTLMMQRARAALTASESSNG